MHPSSTVEFLSIISSSENVLCTPSPWHAGHAPRGLLNENTRGDISGKKAPCSGHANSSEYAIISPSWI